jgi:hypothetical protein
MTNISLSIHLIKIHGFRIHDYKTNLPTHVAKHNKAKTSDTYLGVVAKLLDITLQHDTRFSLYYVSPRELVNLFCSHGYGSRGSLSSHFPAGFRIGLLQNNLYPYITLTPVKHFCLRIASSMLSTLLHFHM